jgi:hypothetical protein
VLIWFFYDYVWLNLSRLSVFWWHLDFKIFSTETAACPSQLKQRILCYILIVSFLETASQRIYLEVIIHRRVRDLWLNPVPPNASAPTRIPSLQGFAAFCLFLLCFKWWPYVFPPEARLHGKYNRIDRTETTKLCNTEVQEAQRSLTPVADYSLWKHFSNRVQHTILAFKSSKIITESSMKSFNEGLPDTWCRDSVGTRTLWELQSQITISREDISFESPLLPDKSDVSEWIMWLLV